jgi:Lrp/AsnC family transcriptional regulator, leucine-responsive regulatory protein
VNVRGVRHTQTYFVLEEVKSTHAVRVRVAEAARAGAGGSKRRRARH